MNNQTKQDNQKLLEHWDKAFSRPAPEREDLPDWHTLAPSEKLFQAAALLGEKKKVLDYGCGSGWASVIAAKSGCPSLTSVDMAPHAVEAACFYAKAYGVEKQVQASCIDAEWLKNVPADYSGLN